MTSGAHGDACDARLTAPRQRVAAAVDRAWPAIVARGESLASAPPYRRVRLGPTYARDRDPTPTKSGWTSRERGWVDLERAIDRAGADASIDEAWIDLARDARALAVFDAARVVAGAWRDATHDALPEQRIKPTGAAKREGAAIVVALDAGVFQSDTQAIAKAIESTWTSPSVSVRVRWTSQSTESTAYKLVLGDVAGEPSSVSDRYREVKLNPDVRMHAIAHEVGHVLGFADRYAKRWDAARCVYVEENDPGDLMSDPEGPVTAQEWALLAGAYPP